MVTALIFLAILMTAVLIHELAHYLNAKSVGLPVESFSVGMGPVIWRKMWRGTEWRLSLLPIGGYVNIPGMAPKQDELGNLQHADEGFATKPLWAKLWVLVGGVLANFLLAVLLLSTVITADPLTRIGVSNLDVQTTAAVGNVMPDSEAERLGLEAGDLISGINGITYPTVEQLIEQVKSADSLTLQVKRGEETLSFATDWPPAGMDVPLLGIGLGSMPVEMPPSINFFSAIGESTRFLIGFIPEAVTGIVRGVGATFTGQQSDDVAGPVQLVNITNQARQAGIIPVLFLAALINFSLAVFNLLPIPGLDGGRMLLASIVALRGKPFRPGQEEFIHFMGVVAVLAFMALITFNELSGLIFKN